MLDPIFVCSEVKVALEDLKAKDIQVLDVTQKSDFTDFMIIATGTSSRHVASMVNNVVHRIKMNKADILGIEGKRASDWVLVDLGDVIVHVMKAEARAFYDLERLWGSFETVSANG